MYRIIGLMLLLISSSVWALDNPLIGQTAELKVAEARLDFHARIDTGASNSSINAFDIKVENGDPNNMKANIGKIVHFTTENERGQQQRLSAKIIHTSTVSNSQGTETRYMVELGVGFAGNIEQIKVNLRDRSHMDYKLLIGRNWLKKGHYLVDVSDKNIIGPIAKINIEKAGFAYKARIDTGAVETSLNAFDLEVHDGVKDKMVKNIGKWISFTTENEKGQQKRITSRIIETSLIRNAQGSEVRYMVQLKLGEKGKEYKVKVNLKDRRHMTYKLLIGRNWLQGHYIVDVSKKYSSKS